MKPDLGLRDIQGLDAISWWPLAPGWWVILGIILLAIAILTISFYRRWRVLKWQYRILQNLDFLEKNLNPETSQATAIELSALIRRLAIRRFSRQECAGLKGEVWLQWLTEKDPRQFNWMSLSRSLIEAPFSPQGSNFDPKNLQQSIQAAKGWVKNV